MQTIIISANSLNEMQSCWYKWHLYKQRYLQPLEKGKHLMQGSFLHQILEVHYNAIKDAQDKQISPDHVEIIAKATDKGRYFAANDPELQGLDANAVTEVIHQYVDYAMYYRNDNWRILAVEAPFVVELYRIEDSEEREGIRILVEGKMDLMKESPEGRDIVDHKAIWREDPPDEMPNQFNLYSCVSKLPNVIINQIGFQKSYSIKDRMSRHLLNFPESKVQEWKQDTIFWAIDLVRHIRENYYPKNRTSCHKYGDCVYLPLCLTTPENREFKIKQLYKVMPKFDLMEKKAIEPETAVINE
jgi:hypothetical protein